MDLTTLRTFVDAAHRLSFASVASQLGTTPSTISRTIKALEDQLGTRLFHRTTRRMSLTQEGAAFLIRAKRILDEWDEAKDDISPSMAEISGTLRMTASIAFGECVVLPLLNRFRQSHPNIKLDLFFTDATLDLTAEAIDLAIRLGPQPAGAVNPAKLIDTHYRVCAAPAYFLDVDRPATPADLAALECLQFTLPEFRSDWMFRAPDGQVQSVPVDGSIAISSALSLRSAALAGLGPALMPNWLIGKDIADGTLLDLFPHHQVTATTFDTAAWLIQPSSNYVPKKTRAMIEYLETNFRTPTSGHKPNTLATPQ